MESAAVLKFVNEKMAELRPLHIEKLIKLGEETFAKALSKKDKNERVNMTLQALVGLIDYAQTEYKDSGTLSDDLYKEVLLGVATAVVIVEEWSKENT